LEAFSASMNNDDTTIPVRATVDTDAPTDSSLTLEFMQSPDEYPVWQLDYAMLIDLAANGHSEGPDITMTASPDGDRVYVRLTSAEEPVILIFPPEPLRYLAYMLRLELSTPLETCEITDADLQALLEGPL